MGPPARLTASSTAIASSRPVSATITTNGRTPNTPIITTKPPNTFSMVWPAVMLANSRTEWLTGRMK